MLSDRRALLEGRACRSPTGWRSRRGSAARCCATASRAPGASPAAPADPAPEQASRRRATSRHAGYRASGWDGRRGGSRRWRERWRPSQGRRRRRPASTRSTPAAPPGASGTTARGSWSIPSTRSPPTRTAPATTTSASTSSRAAAPPTAPQASLQFITPSGTTIADFRLTKRIIFRNPTQDGTHRYHVITALGGTAIEGAGNYANGTRDRLNGQGRWYGYPEGNADTGIVTVSRASFPALAGIPGRRPQPDACGSAARSAARPAARPARRTSPTTSAARRSTSTTRPRPRDLTVDASGLLRGGQVAGSDPVRVKVSDPSGIRRVEIVDVTGTPTVVGAEDYDTDAGGVQTDRGASCNFRFASPCPQLSYGETLRATSLQAGRRKLLVRAYDAGGNVVERGPYEAEVVTPSDRGALNGADATETGTDHRPLHARQQPHAAHDRLPLQGRRRRAAAQRRRAADHQRARRRAHARHRRRRGEAAHLRHDRRRGPLPLPRDGLRVAAVPVRLDLARQRRPLRRQRLRDAAARARPRR